VKVKSGETLETIASTYRAPPWAIAQINKLDADRPLEPGRTLIIPRSLYANVVPPAAASPTATRPAAPPVARLAPNPPPQAEAPAAGSTLTPLCRSAVSLFPIKPRRAWKRRLPSRIRNRRLHMTRRGGRSAR
jgi:hypothetical protein